MKERVRDKDIEQITDKLQQRMSDILDRDPNDPEQDTVSMVYSAVLQGEELTKEQSKWLKEFLK